MTIKTSKISDLAGKINPQSSCPLPLGEGWGGVLQFKIRYDMIVNYKVRIEK